MPSTLVAAALAALLAAALLGDAFGPRSVAVVVAAGVAPDLDAFAGLVVEGLHNALLHNVFVPALAAALVLWDTRYRDDSWLRGRYGAWGVRVAWVAVAAYVVPGILLDLLNVESAAPLYPVHDRFYSVVGRFEVNNKQGIVFTFIQPNLGPGPLFPGARRGTVAGQYVVPTFLNPAPGPDQGLERVFFAVESGWELLVILAGVTVVAARTRLRSWGVV
ncbi:metal-dependent hydrolase [Halorarius halobius]|uniref:metal-dependent hydrolase n=1 Tax=Halorarius halobius TaxID=2962671 RepID=UPI0020CE0D68|nr:metal-dependent hydrolase [Halorarius halobius]